MICIWNHEVEAQTIHEWLDWHIDQQDDQAMGHSRWSMILWQRWKSYAVSFWQCQNSDNDRTLTMSGLWQCQSERPSSLHGGCSRCSSHGSSTDLSQRGLSGFWDSNYEDGFWALSGSHPPLPLELAAVLQQWTIPGVPSTTQREKFGAAPGGSARKFGMAPRGRHGTASWKEKWNRNYL